MAPKGKAVAKATPKAAATDKAKGLQLIGDGGKLTKDAHNAMNYHLTKLAKDGKPEIKAKYKELKTDDARRSFALKLKLDPEGSFATVTEHHGVSSTNTEGRISGWWSLWEIAKELGLPWNPKDEAATKIVEDTVDGCETRPHQVPGLAKSGHKEYYWVRRLKTQQEAKKTRQIDLHLKQEIKASEAEGIMDMIDAEPPADPIDGRIKKKQKKDPEQKKLDDEIAQKAKEDKLKSMSPDERKKMVDQQQIADYKKKMNGLIGKLNTAIGKAAKLEGKLSTMKESKYLNPQKILKGLESQASGLKGKLDKCQKTAGLAECVSAYSLKSKKFTGPIEEADEQLQKWSGFDQGISKHVA